MAACTNVPKPIFKIYTEQILYVCRGRALTQKFWWHLPWMQPNNNQTKEENITNC